MKYERAVLWALHYDPNAADLWFGLARMRLKAGDQGGYTAAMARLQQLTPGVQYQIVSMQH